MTLELKHDEDAPFIQGVASILMRTLEAENPRLRVTRTERDDYGRINMVRFITPTGHQFLLCREPNEVSGEANSVCIQAAARDGSQVFSYVHYKQGGATLSGDGAPQVLEDFTPQHQEIYDRVDRICEVVAAASATSDL